MGSRRNQGADHHHHWSRSSSSYNKKPPLNIWKPTVPRWEKMFCASVCITWSKLVETKKYLCLYEKVMNWDDSGGKEEFDNAKKRFWASMNGLPCDIPLPDPNTYINDIDWNSTADPELVQDLEKYGIKPSEQGQDEKVVIIDSFPLLDQSFSGSGWGVNEADMPKHSEFVSSAEVNQHQNNDINLETQYYSPSYSHHHAATNNTWRWNQREHYRSYSYGMGRGAGWNKKSWYRDYKMKGKILWQKAPAFHDRSDYQMGSEGINNGVGGEIFLIIVVWGVMHLILDK